MARTQSYKAKHSVEYKAWINMLHRCHNPDNPSFRKYGQRGILVCDDWRHATKGFANFLRDMGSRPAAGLSLERLDNNSGYSKSNCTWADKKTQQNNLGEYELYQLDLGLGFGPRRSPYISYRGYTKTLKEWSNDLRINNFTIRQRLLKGMSVEQALAKVSYKNCSKPDRLASLLLPPEPTIH